MIGKAYIQPIMSTFRDGTMVEKYLVKGSPSRLQQKNRHPVKRHLDRALWLPIASPPWRAIYVEIAITLVELQSRLAQRRVYSKPI